MAALTIKPTHKAVVAYYDALRQLSLLDLSHEGAVKVAFQRLLETCAGRMGRTLVLDWEIRRPEGRPLRVDGAVVDDFRLAHGYWEAKDSWRVGAGDAFHGRKDAERRAGFRRAQQPPGRRLVSWRRS
ncbi:MAG: hypothetical protein HY744_01080 [Deltaproteobacteria bacterium]|nr:hypothetical protein [Deltaproteobacteria bacterium]